MFHQLKVRATDPDGRRAGPRRGSAARQFEDAVGTAISYLLSDGRDVAIQMTAVAATMAGNEVRDGMTAPSTSSAPMRFRADEVQG